MRRTTAVIVLLCALSLPATALAGGGGDAVIRDCVQHGNLTKTYTQSQYKDALQNLPADLQEYSNCGQVIAEAKRDAANQANRRHNGTSSDGQTTPPASGGGGTAGGGTGGATPATPGGDAGGSPGPSSQGGGGATPRAHDHQAGQPQAPTTTPTPTPTLRPLTAADLRPATATAADRGLGALPTPLLVVLVLLAVVALAGLTAGAWRRRAGLADLGRLRRVIPRRGT